ncbi:hypothetical protein V9T40_008383 [Parthenolecanium corni]|uniref:Uncharacterized protein n=1 Tax=Parthenolecanium corni TaxID=536013 RepID=A0AAN9TNF9_9HEMI
MIAFFTSFSVFFVSALIIKKVYELLFNHVLGPALFGGIDFKKKGQWAVVTGATDGVGKAYAEKLAKRGLDIVLISRTKEKLEAAALEIENRYKVQTKIIAADFAEGNQVISTIEKELFDLDIGVLVNNVGLSYSHPEYFLEVKDREKHFNDIVQVNIFSVLNMCQIVMPRMVEKKKGVVINISSASALFPSPLLTVYAASKEVNNSFNFRLVVSIFGWMSHFSACCLNFRLVVSIFGWMSNFSSSWFNFQLDVSSFVQLSQFSSGCLNFRLDVSNFCLVVSIFGWMSNFLSSCLNFRLVVSIFGWMSNFSSSFLNFHLIISSFV